jgi:TolA-binding protein
VIETHVLLESEWPQSALLGEVALLAAKAHGAAEGPEKAEAILRKAAAGPPDAEDTKRATLALGECLAESRKFADSLAVFDGFLERYPKDPAMARARLGRAWALENQGDLDAALEAYREVAATDRTPTGTRAQFQVGQCLAARGRHGDAIVEFLQVQAAYAYPEWSSKALLQAAACFETLGDKKNARKHYEEVVTAWPERDEAKLAKERLEKLALR